MNVALLSALGCALCNGLAAVLQKMSADKVSALRGIKLRVFANLLRRSHYQAGIVLDIAAGLLTLVAVHRLPLFLAQSIIACSVIVTAIIERLWLRIRLARQTYIAIVLLLAGLSLLSLATHSQAAPLISSRLHNWLLLASPLLFVTGLVCLRFKSKSAAVLLAVCSGTAFGMVSVVGRVLVYPRPLWTVFTKPLAMSIAVNAVIGMLFFTIALQRSSATSVNSVMVAIETVFPIFIGVLFLGDTAKNGRWPFMAGGIGLVLIGFILVIVSLNSATKLEVTAEPAPEGR